MATTDNKENFGIPSLGGNFKVGIKSTTIIEQLTLRPLTSERINNWNKIFSPIENIDLSWTINFLTEIHTNGKLNSIADTKPLNAKFPILIFQPGATGSTQDYAFLLEQFASYGIIVLSIDRPIAEGIDKFYFLPTD